MKFTFVADPLDNPNLALPVVPVIENLKFFIQSRTCRVQSHKKENQKLSSG